MKILEESRRVRAARAFALLALTSLALIVVASVVSIRDEMRTLLAIAALVGYASFAGRAMRIWQGRGHPSLHRRAWRRRFLDERTDASSRELAHSRDRYESRRPLAHR